MFDAVLVPLEHLMTSWWLYAALFGVCALDALVPVFPSEAPVIMAGVYAASDPRGPQAWLVVLVAMLGAALGDHLSYGLGHLVVGKRLLAREGRHRSVVARVEKVLHERGAWALLVVRLIPGGRSVATLSLGATRYPLLRRFMPYDLLATGVWAAHGVIVGYLGGRAFEHNPIAAIATGLGVAMLIAGLGELRRSRRMSPLKNPAECGEKERS